MAQQITFVNPTSSDLTWYIKAAQTETGLLPKRGSKGNGVVYKPFNSKIVSFGLLFTAGFDGVVSWEIDDKAYAYRVQVSKLYDDYGQKGSNVKGSKAEWKNNSQYDAQWMWNEYGNGLRYDYGDVPASQSVKPEVVVVVAKISRNYSWILSGFRGLVLMQMKPPKGVKYQFTLDNQ